MPSRCIFVRWDPDAYCYVAKWAGFMGVGETRDEAIFDLGYVVCLCGGKA